MKVIFYYNAQNRLNAAIDLILRAHAKNKSAYIFSDCLDLLNQINQQLWEKALFLPHLYADEPHAQDTPFLLSENIHAFKTPQPLIFLPQTTFEESLENLTSFPFVYEIMDEDEATKKAGRERVTTYKKMGFPIQYINLMA